MIHIFNTLLFLSVSVTLYARYEQYLYKACRWFFSLLK